MYLLGIQSISDKLINYNNDHSIYELCASDDYFNKVKQNSENYLYPHLKGLGPERAQLTVQSHELVIVMVQGFTAGLLFVFPLHSL